MYPAVLCREAASSGSTNQLEGKDASGQAGNGQRRAGNVARAGNGLRVGLVAGEGAEVTIFPIAETEEQFDVVEDEQLLPGVEALCARLGYGDTRVTQFEEGSLPVYAVGEDLVVKLFPPVHADEMPIEAGVIAALEGRLAIPTPRLVDAGEFGGWSYVAMSRLHGEGLKTAWPRIPQHERERLAAQAGEALRELHKIPAPVAVTFPGDWAGFVATQQAQAVERQRGKQLDEEWVEQIPAFLDSVDLSIKAPVLLHTEFMDAHLLAQQQDDGRWELTGLFDFEPAMRGAPEYDFVAAGIFITRGDQALMSQLASAYGAPIDARKVMAYTLLHQYANLPWYLKEVPADGASTFDDLAQRWFGLPAGATG